MGADHPIESERHAGHANDDAGRIPRPAGAAADGNRRPSVRLESAETVGRSEMTSSIVALDSIVAVSAAIEPRRSGCPSTEREDAIHGSTRTARTSAERARRTSDQLTL